MDEEKLHRKCEDESENVSERERERERESGEKCMNTRDSSVTDTHCS